MSELQEELKEKDQELERVTHTLYNLEKALKTQDRAMDHLSTTHKDVNEELNALREENAKLRVELRHHKQWEQMLEGIILCFILSYIRILRSCISMLYEYHIVNFQI